MFQLLSNTSSSPWQFIAAGTVATGANPTVTLPSGWASGDLLVLWGGSNSNFTSPAGWTVPLNHTATNPRAIFAYKFATGGETSLSLTNSGTSTSAVMLAYRNISAVDVTGTVNTGSSTSPATTSLTTTVPDDLVVSCYSNNSNTSPFTGTPASTNVRVNFDGTATSTRPLLIVDENKSTAGATTSRIATISSTLWTTFAASFKQT